MVKVSSSDNFVFTQINSCLLPPEPKSELKIQSRARMEPCRTTHLKSIPELEKKMFPRRHLIWTRHRDQKSIFSPRKKDVLILPEQDFADLDFIFALILCQSSFPKTQNFVLKKNAPMKTEYIFKLFFTKNQTIASIKRCLNPPI